MNNPRRTRPRRWDAPPSPVRPAASLAGPPPAPPTVTGATAAGAATAPVRGPSMRDMPVGDDRTCEWERHAEALALGLGLLDEDEDERLPPLPFPS